MTTQRFAFSLRSLLGAALMVWGSAAQAGETNVAVAANFTGAAKEIAQSFTAKTGHTVLFSFGSTGQLYTQISQDAPFTVLLSADDTTPRKAIDQGLAVANSNFAYAYGKLVLWSKSADLIKGENILKSDKFEKLAIADPKLAPYGAAAIEVLKAMGLAETLDPKIVKGNNIAQTLQFVDSGAAEIGFVALSQVITKTEGSRWVVSANLYQPIQQDAVLLKKGANDPVAQAFLDFLKGPEARKVIESYGYGTAAGS